MKPGVLSLGDRKPLPRSLADWKLDPELLKPPARLVSDILYEGRSTVLSGLPKAGKSTLACQIAAAVSNGGEFLTEPVRKGAVLWYALDEFIGETVRRLDRLGANEHNVSIEVERPEGVTELVRFVDALQPLLVVIDCAGEWWTGRVQNSNSAEEIRTFMAPYLQAMRNAGVAVLLLHHTNRGGLRGAGSVALEAVPDVSLVLVNPSQRRLLNASGTDEFDEDATRLDDGRRVVQGMSRFSPQVRLSLKWTGTEYRGDDAEPFHAKVFRALEEQSQSTRDLAESMRARKQKVADAIAYLAERGKVQRDGRKWKCSSVPHIHNNDGNT